MPFSHTRYLVSNIIAYNFYNFYLSYIFFIKLVLNTVGKTTKIIDIKAFKHGESLKLITIFKINIYINIINR